MALHEPNYTQIPNEILDEWMYQLSGAEFQILMFICRKTLGWQKKRDKISVSQIKLKTGYSHTKILDALKRLQELDLIIVRGEERKIKEFELKFIESGQLTLPAGQLTLPDLNQSGQLTLYTKEKDKQTKQKKEPASNEAVLFNNVKDFFVINNADYYHDVKEAKAIKTIIARGRVRDIILEKLQKFKQIKEKDKSQWWQSVPFTPSAFLSRWDYITAHKFAEEINKTKSGYKTL